MKNHSLFYCRPNSDKYYYIKTFLSQHQDYQIIESHPLLTLLRRFKSDFYLIFNRVINRYMIYKRNLCTGDGYGLLVHIFTIHNEKTLEYRDQGEWVYWELMRGDLYKRGSERPKDVVNNVLNVLFAPSLIELNYFDQAIQIDREINKYFNWWKTGRISSTIGQSNPDTKKNKRIADDKKRRRYWMNMRTGQKLTEQQFKENNLCFQADVTKFSKQKPAEQPTLLLPN